MLDAYFYNTLSRLQLKMQHKSSQNLSGGRKSLRRGSSAEFSDFREYMQGDDLRRLDWNAYARLDKLYIRQYMEEKEAVVSVLVDTSASMDYGEKSKAELARDLAAVVSYLALNNMDRLMLYDMKDMSRGLSVGGGKNAFFKVLRWLEGLTFSGQADMLGAAGKMRPGGAGITVLISDFLHPDLFAPEGERTSEEARSRKAGRKGPGMSGTETEEKRTALADGREKKKSGGNVAGRSADRYEKLLQYLEYRKQRPVILHTLAEEELRISMEGAWNLIDAEDGTKLRLTVDARTIECYERQLQRLTERMKKGCAACGGAYVLCDAGKDRSRLVFQDLREIYDI